MAEELTDGSIFLHVPKTGGQWIELLLKELGMNKGRVRALKAHDGIIAHLGYNVIRDYLKEDRPMFAFFRNPQGWYESYWRFREGYQRHHNPVENWGKWPTYEKKNPLSSINDAACSDFNGFVRKCLELYPDGWVSHLYQSFEPESLAYRGKFENLHHDLIAILRDRRFYFADDQVTSFAPYNASVKLPIEWDADLLNEMKEKEKVAYAIWEGSGL
jgi:hypothetical protein